MSEQIDEKKTHDGTRTFDVLVRHDEVEYRWYGEKPSPTTFGEATWIPSCWARPTLKEAMALLEEDRFVNSGMLNTPLKLLSAVHHYCHRAIIMYFHLHVLLKPPGLHLQAGSASLFDKLLKQGYCLLWRCRLNKTRTAPFPGISQEGKLAHCQQFTLNVQR